MSTTSCTRSWQAEALEDGRIDASDRQSYERHLETCASCAHELTRIRQLRQTIRDLPYDKPSELTRRRQRAALLQQANHSLVAHRPMRTGWLVVAVVLITTAAAAATVVVSKTVFSSSPASSASATPALSATSNAPSRRGRPSSHETNEQGEVTQELTSVSVDDPPPSIASATSAASPASPVLSASSASSAVHDSSATESPSAQPATPKGAAAGARFGEAMSAFASGDFVRAESLFGSFIKDFPRDSRTEDAAFLQIQCRLRRGDSAGAAMLARAYLQAFPKALRRPEVERYAGSAQPAATRYLATCSSGTFAITGASARHSGHALAACR
ncbi:MAG: tetratricopeptide repeat protein [Polyangiaceae bacterium]